MGNYNTRTVRFRQSVNDFPLMVSLGRNTPSFGLNRFKEGLRFIPPDDECFILRGDRQRLLYKGRRRSHRFTILGDSSFEYDCILLREPESNVITLRIEGAEYYDFFRQPDFLKEPLLAGSYAVYKKETLIGEGTGKLCHIHRPEIIDARGRRCWGDLSVIGNELNITIPEKFLSEAKYPVVVDPTIGTTTIGSQTTSAFKDTSGSTENGLYGALGVNRFLLPEAFNGTATAFVYVWSGLYMNPCKPVLYADIINYPGNKRSTNEGNINVAVASGQAGEWRSTTFSTNTNIQSGNYVWFGLSAALFIFRFDYGLKMFWYYYRNYEANLPNTYPLFPDQRSFDYKMSAYFTFTNPQNYVRNITQGVSFTDTNIVNNDFKRTAVQTVQTNDNTNTFLTICRKIIDTLQGLGSITKDFLFIRSIQETFFITDTIPYFRALLRGITDIVPIESETKSGWVLFTNILDTVRTSGTVFRGLIFFVRIVTSFFVRDYILRRFLIARHEVVLKSCVCREIILESKIG